MIPHTVHSDTSQGSRRTIVVTAHYPGAVSRFTTFTGASTPGYPGPVIMGTADGLTVHVSDPARFGDTFDREWISRFYS